MKVTYNSSKKKQQPALEDGLQVQYAQAKRIGYKMRWYMLLFLVLAPLCLIIWLAIRPYILILAPGIITAEPLEMRAPSAARVVNVLVKAGDNVDFDEIIIRLSDAQLDAQINELKKQLSVLNNKQRSNNQKIISGLQYRVSVAQEGVIWQNELLQSYQKFRLKGIVPNSDMATVLQANTEAKMNFEQAKVDLLNEKAKQATEKRVGLITRQRNSIALQLAQLIAKKQSLIIRAPFPGKIEDTIVQRGEHITKGQPLLWLSSREKPIVITFVDAKYLDYVAIGQQATVNLPSGEALRAEILDPTEIVSRIPTQLAGPFDGEKTGMKVRLTLEDDLTFAVEGVPVEVRFDYNSKRIKL